MAGAFGGLQRGLSDAVLNVLSGAADTAGSTIDIAGVRSLAWTAESSSETIEGDDAILGVAYSSKEGTGTLTTAGASLTSLAPLLGTTAVVSGTTPNQITTMEETAGPNLVYAKIRGLATSVDVATSAYEVTLWKCKVGSVEESLELNSWNIPSLSFSFIKDANSKFITRKYQETKVPLV